MRSQFKDTTTALAEIDENVVVVVGDISGYMFKPFQDAYPERFYNMGICENTLISVTAGLASQGLRPFVHTINPFLTERSFEQIKLDMSYNEFAGNIVTCGASFDYAWDGATHHSYTDLASLRMLPRMEVIQPGSKQETDQLIRSQYANEKPTYFRLSDHSHDLKFDEIEFGKGIEIKGNPNYKITIVTAGPILQNVYQASEELSANLLYFHTLKPFDHELIKKYAHTKIIVVHDAFGLREAVNEVPYLQTEYIGIPDQFCCFYGTVHDVRREIGLDVESLRKAFINRIDLVGKS